MADKDIQALEQLVFSSSHSPTSFVPGSEHYFYFHLLQLLEATSAPFSQAYEDLLSKFAQSHPHSPLLKTIKIRTFLKRYELESDQAEKAKILSQFNETYLHLKFDYPAPSASAQGSSLYPSELDESVLVMDREKAEKDVAYFERLSQEEIQLIDVNRMSEDVFKKFLNLAPLHLYPEAVPRLAKLTEIPANSSLISLISKLTLDQIQELCELNPTLRGNESVVRTLFSLQYYSKSTGTVQEKADRLLKVLTWTRTLPPKFESLQLEILFQLLILLPEIGEYREDLFLEYLKLHGSGHLFKTDRSTDTSFFQRPGQDPGTEESVLNQYLERILSGKGNVDEYSAYLTAKFLEKAISKAKIHSGSDPNTFPLSAQELELLSQEVVLELTPDNKKVFTRTSPVALKLSVKNVPKLIVKVLELNTTSYYLQNLSEIPETLNLDGLEAGYQVVIDYSSESKFLKTERVIEIPILGEKAGVFAVEFIGNGRHARALIKKGTLKLVSKITAAGHQMTVLDEDNQICTGSGAGLYIDQRFYELTPDKKSVIVPFKGAETDTKAIITDGLISELVTFRHKAENYELKTGFIVLEESLIMGSIATVAIQPKLFVSGLPGPVQLMKKAYARVTTKDFDGISTAKTYSNIEIPPEDGVIPIEFEVPAKVATLQVEFGCEVTPISKSVPISLTSSHSIQVSQNSARVSCTQLFLRRSQGIYYIQVLGKNGEPKSKEIVTVATLLPSGRQIPKLILSSNEAGFIKLGVLAGVTGIRVACQSGGSEEEENNQWQLEAFKSAVQYPSSLNLCEGDSFGVPFFRKSGAGLRLQEAAILTYTDDGSLISASTDHLRYEETTSLLYISGLLQGHHVLSLGSGEKISVEVLKGTHWGNNQYIISDEKVIQTHKQYRSLMVRSAEVQEQRLVVKLAGAFEDAKVHIVLHNFLSETLLLAYKQVAALYGAKTTDEIVNPPLSSRYLPSRQLNEEYTYVLERQLQPKFTGNILQKPQLLLKPILLQDTKTDTQTAAPGSSFSKRMMAGDRFMMNAMAPSHSPVMLTNGHVNIDFLEHAATIHLSRTVPEDGVLTLEIPEGNYTLATIIAVNDDATAFATADFSSLGLKTKDLALRVALSGLKTYAETRKCSVIRASEDLVITDMASASMQIIDSIGKLGQLLVQVSKLSGSELKVEDWDFLWNWHGLSREEKNEKYDKFVSHELNLFLFMKDAEYFETVVRPFLLSKMEKTLVDKFLLGESLEDFLDPQKILKLNSLEKVLLIHNTRNVGGQNVAKTLIEQAQVIIKDEATEQKLFDAVLKFNIEGAEKDELEQFLQEEKKEAEKQQRREYEEGRRQEMMRAAAAPQMMFNLQSQREMLSEEMEHQDFAMNEMMMDMPVRAMASAPQARFLGGPPRAAAPQARFGDSGGMVGMAAPRVMMKSLDIRSTSSRSKVHGSLEAKMPSAKRMVHQEAKMEEGEEAESLVRDLMAFDDAPPADIIQMRETQRPYFQQMDSTKEYAETQYYGIKYPSQFYSLAPISLFWASLAQAASSGSLLSLGSSVLFATNNLTTYVAALSFSDLPLQPSKHGYINQGLGIRIKAASHFLAFHKSMEEAKSELQESVLCAQRYFDPKDRYQVRSGSEKEEKTVKEFVVGTVYGCQVIVTNVSVASLPAHVLVQIPEGAIPVKNLDYTKSHIMILSSYETKTLEHYFYFPAVGEYRHAPVNVSINGEVISVSNPFLFQVHASKSLLSADSLKDVSTSGDIDLVLSYLSEKNPHSPEVREDLKSVLWMLSDKEKFGKLTKVLREKQFFHREIWAFGIRHGDVEAVKELLEADNQLRERVGYFFNSSLIATDSLGFRHLDFNPMVNARAYRLANQARITNKEFRETYERLLFFLAHKPVLDSIDHLILVQYLIYQDRIQEAQELLGRVAMRPSEKTPGNSPLQLQYDYLMCYLHPDSAESLARLYLDYPIPGWKLLFTSVLDQLKEIEEEKSGEEKKTEPLTAALSFTVEKGKVKITYSNVSLCVIRLYEVDIEVLFSRNPFFMKDTELFTYVSPNFSETVNLNAKSPFQEYQLNDKWSGKNAFVEVEFDGKKLFQTYFANRINVQVIEQYGLVKVTDLQKQGLPRTYVKVFSQEKGGQTTFYKDGYTDVRGKFDYVSLNTDQLNRVENFSILVCHDELGSAIVTARPPAK